MTQRRKPPLAPKAQIVPTTQDPPEGDDASEIAGVDPLTNVYVQMSMHAAAFATLAWAAYKMKTGNKREPDE